MLIRRVFFFSSSFFLISSLVSSANAGSSSRTLLPTPLCSLSSSESSVPWPNAAPALSTLRLEAFGHLSPALCLALGPSISHSVSLSPSLSPSRSAAPDPNGDPDAYAAAAAAAERACFLMDFWLMFWALLWVPTPSRSHEPYSIDFQLRRGLSYATTLRWPNQSFDYRATTLDSKNILQLGTIYILYTVIYSPMGQQMSERGPKITERVH